MFVLSFKSVGYRLTAILLSLAAVLAIILIFGVCNKDKTECSADSGFVNTNEERVAFLENFGWSVLTEPSDVRDVIIPAEFDDTYAAYNEIQLSQGYDLSQFRGKKVRKWEYNVTNYPGYIGKDCIFATVLILDGRIIGGDIYSSELDGFMCGLKGN